MFAFEKGQPMKRLSLVVFALGMVSTVAKAELFTVKAKVISSESELKANSVPIYGGVSSGNRTLAGEDDSVTAFGYGADVDFVIQEQFHAGAGVAYTDYMNDNEKASYSDLVPRVYGGVDLYKTTTFSANFQAGVSYHSLDLKDTNMGQTTIAYKDLDLWNYDLGVNVDGSLAKDVTIGLGYQYTNTFRSEGVDVNYSGFGLVSTPTRLKDIKLAKNEVIGSVGYQF